MEIEKKNKHMTLQDRLEIQECLSKGMSYKAIAKRIEKNSTTVSREVKLHSTVHRNGFVETKETCLRLLKAPFVCNGYAKRSHSHCVYPRRIYTVKNTQAEYETLLVEAREGIPLNKEEFYRSEPPQNFLQASNFCDKIHTGGANMPRRKRNNGLSEEKRNIIGQLVEMYDIRTYRRR